MPRSFLSSTVSLQQAALHETKRKLEPGQQGPPDGLCSGLCSCVHNRATLRHPITRFLNSAWVIYWTDSWEVWCGWERRRLTWPLLAPDRVGAGWRDPGPFEHCLSLLASCCDQPQNQSDLCKRGPVSASSPTSHSMRAVGTGT